MSKIGSQGKKKNKKKSKNKKESARHRQSPVTNQLDMEFNALHSSGELASHRQCQCYRVRCDLDAEFSASNSGFRPDMDLLNTHLHPPTPPPAEAAPPTRKVDVGALAKLLEGLKPSSTNDSPYSVSPAPISLEDDSKCCDAGTQTEVFAEGQKRPTSQPTHSCHHSPYNDLHINVEKRGSLPRPDTSPCTHSNQYYRLASSTSRASPNSRQSPISGRQSASISPIYTSPSNTKLGGTSLHSPSGTSVCNFSPARSSELDSCSSCHHSHAPGMRAVRVSPLALSSQTHSPMHSFSPVCSHHSSACNTPRSHSTGCRHASSSDLAAPTSPVLVAPTSQSHYCNSPAHRQRLNMPYLAYDDPRRPPAVHHITRFFTPHAFHAFSSREGENTSSGADETTDKAKTSHTPNSMACSPAGQACVELRKYILDFQIGDLERMSPSPSLMMSLADDSDEEAVGPSASLFRPSHPLNDSLGASFKPWVFSKTDSGQSVPASRETPLHTGEGVQNSADGSDNADQATGTQVEGDEDGRPGEKEKESTTESTEQEDREEESSQKNVGVVPKTQTASVGLQTEQLDTHDAYTCHSKEGRPRPGSKGDDFDLFSYDSDGDLDDGFCISCRNCVLQVYPCEIALPVC